MIPTLSWQTPNLSLRVICGCSVHGTLSERVRVGYGRVRGTIQLMSIQPLQVSATNSNFGVSHFCAVIKDRIFNTQNILCIIEIFQLKKNALLKRIIQKKENENQPTTFLCCWRLDVAGRGCSEWFYAIQSGQNRADAHWPPAHSPYAYLLIGSREAFICGMP